jgi:hypothetical protein
MSNVFLPTNHQHWYDGRPSECESACLKQCSCTGYAYDKEHRCLVWYGPLLNTKQFLANNTFTNDFYLKLARVDLVSKGISVIGDFYCSFGVFFLYFIYFSDFLLQTQTAINGTVIDSGFKNQLWKIVVPTASIAVVVTLGLFIYYVKRKLRRKGE